MKTSKMRRKYFNGDYLNLFRKKPLKGVGSWMLFKFMVCPSIQNNNNVRYVFEIGLIPQISA